MSDFLNENKMKYPDEYVTIQTGTYDREEESNVRESSVGEFNVKEYTLDEFLDDGINAEAVYEVKDYVKQKNIQLTREQKRRARAEEKRERKARKERKELEDAIRARENRHREEREAKEDLALRLMTLRESSEKTIMKISNSTKVASSEFKTSFSTKVSDEARAKKILNKRSRLFQKNKNAKDLNGCEEQVKADALKNMDALYGDKKDVLGDDYYDIAAFADVNKDITYNMISSLAKNNHMSVADHMFDCLSDTKLGSIRLDNDKELAANAPKIERLGLQLTAFVSFAESHGYFYSLDEKTKKAVETRLDQLRSIVYYYDTRKELITDPYYMSHYNEELSMDYTSVDDNDPESEQKIRVAKKIQEAYLAGKDMLLKNNASAALIRKQKKREFEQSVHASEHFGEYIRSEQYKQDMYQRHQIKGKQKSEFERLIHVNDEKIEQKYGFFAIKENMRESGNDYAVKVSNYMESLSSDEFISDNTYLKKCKDGKIQNIPDNVDLAEKLSKKADVQEAKVDENKLAELKAQVRSMTHVFKTLQGFSSGIVNVDFTKDSKAINKAHLVYLLALEGKKMLKEYENLKDQAEDEQVQDFEADLTFDEWWNENNISDMDDSDIESVENLINDMIMNGKAFDSKDKKEP